MARSHRDTGLHIVAALAMGLGFLTAAFGAISAIGLAPDIALMVIAAVQSLIGVLLIPAGIGIALRKPWGRTFGIVTFGGIAVLQAAPLFGGPGIGIPLIGLGFSLGCTLYLVLAGEAFESSDDERALSKDESAHDVIR